MIWNPAEGIHIGPLFIRFYSLMFVVAFGFGWYIMKKIFILVIIMWLPSFGQQDSQFTQYMYNTININPAYAGSRDVLSVFGLHRNQWVGLDGAPVTNTFAIHSPLRNENLGLGLSFINDRIGPSDENSISIDFSYTIPVSLNLET